MIIKKIDIKNFMCYYGIDNTFEFEDGLNIILGENGEGKTKFFEAILWLLEGDKNFKSKISAKAIKENELGDTFEVGVKMQVVQYSEFKTVERSFDVTSQKDKNDLSISNSRIIGIVENNTGEREMVDGEKLLDMIFPVEIRKYSLFKGESELNIFDNRDALSNLVNSFSSGKHYEKYVDIGSYLKKKAEAAVDRETKNNTKRQREMKSLKEEIQTIDRELKKIDDQITIKENQKIKTDQKIKEAEKYVDNADSLIKINSRISNIQQQITQEERRIKENFTTYLFDDLWILVNFESIHRDYADKIDLLQKNRRVLQQEYDIEKGNRKGREELTEEIISGKVPLPISVPSKTHMEEMIKEKFCKVCNRPAEEGSPAYNYMKQRLEKYLASQKSVKEKPEEKKVLFKNNYTQLLFNLSATHEDSLSQLRDIEHKIKNTFEFNTKRRNKINDLKEQLETEIKDRERIIGSSTAGEQDLINNFKNYTSWQRDISAINKSLSDLGQDKKSLKQKLDEKTQEKEDIDMESASSFLTKTRKILRDIEIIFRDVKETKYDEFILELERKSNSILQDINIDDFTGTIKFYKKIIGGKLSINIELREKEDIYYNPNQSLVTSMHMAILFAISELASELKNESYPMIFDAPTSSFGETKTKDFLNLIYKTKKQRIILFKNFVGKDKTGKQTINPDFDNVKRHRAFWIQRQRPFDKNDLSTINTEIISNI